MATQTTSLESKLDTLGQKAEEYDTRTNTEEKVAQAKADLKELNRALHKLKNSLDEFERQVGILTNVFGESLPEGASARDRVRSLTNTTQEDILDMIEDRHSLSRHIDEVRKTREKVNNELRLINDQLKEIQRKKLSDASTAESIQKIVGEDPDAMDTISRYRSFLKSILNPNDPVSRLKSRWQGLEKAFEDLDTDWEGFRHRHGLREQTIEDLKTLSREGKVDLDDISDESVNEMLDVLELRTTIKVSL